METNVKDTMETHINNDGNVVFSWDDPAARYALRKYAETVGVEKPLGMEIIAKLRTLVESDVPTTAPMPPKTTRTRGKPKTKKDDADTSTDV